MTISNIPVDVRQSGVGIGRVTRPGLTLTIASGTALSQDSVDLRIFAGAILDIPAGHTGTVTIYEAGDEGGNYAILGANNSDNSAVANVTIPDPVGGRPYVFPANIFPAYHIKIGIPAASTATRVYGVRPKG